MVTYQDRVAFRWERVDPGNPWSLLLGKFKQFKAAAIRPLPAGQTIILKIYDNQEQEFSSYDFYLDIKKNSEQQREYIEWIKQVAVDKYILLTAEPLLELRAEKLFQSKMKVW